MVVKIKSRIRGHPKAYTLYLTIPSDMASDPRFPFRAQDLVSLEILNESILITKCDK